MRVGDRLQVEGEHWTRRVTGVVQRSRRIIVFTKIERKVEGSGHMQLVGRDERYPLDWLTAHSNRLPSVMVEA